MTGGVRLGGARIAGRLLWAPACAPARALCNGARVGELVDDPRRWPHVDAGGVLALDGFRYDAISRVEGARDGDVVDVRLRWLGGQGDSPRSPTSGWFECCARRDGKPRRAGSRWKSNDSFVEAAR